LVLTLTPDGYHDLGIPNKHNNISLKEMDAFTHGPCFIREEKANVFSKTPRKLSLVAIGQNLTSGHALAATKAKKFL
jgi:hypothetical protein